MDTNETVKIPRPVIHGLAVVGFVAMVGAGMALAIYGARFVPTAVQGLSGAAVSLVSIFVSNESEEPTEAEPTAVAPAEEEAPVAPAATTTPVSTPREVVNVYTSGTAVPSADELFGNPDLAVTINTVGYLTMSTGAFVPATTIPADARRSVVQFVIQNRGTNVAASGWRFTASLPSRTDATFRSEPQPALLPGERIEYTLGFERPVIGADLPITITVRADGDIISANDTVQTTVTITH